MTPEEIRRVRPIIGACTCGIEYTSRDLIAPDCALHNFGGEVYDAIRSAEAEAEMRGAKAALLRAVKLFTEYGWGDDRCVSQLRDLAAHPERRRDGRRGIH